ncbi:helicase with zinc finger domain 2-like isoform X2 [Osmerus eperlanus]|uniref:helicase with zinc finger domain 2-like isoform X2 n=1 Tax=Osmerus eperlanus TaxID=29151 RepID=UPI002E0E94D5
MASQEILWDLLVACNLEVVCTVCSVKVNEITYTLQPSTNHNCSRDLLLAQGKDTDKWRPISRRPSYPNPGHYQVCWFFLEGSGCTRHKNRCTFPRSLEEAAVWNFEKHNRVDHSTLIRLLTDYESDAKCEKEDIAGSRPTNHSSTYNLKVVCSICSVKEDEITYRCEGVIHQCSRDILLAQVKGTSKWRHISQRPPRNVSQYQLCWYFVEGSGCTKHHEKCTFARSHEEAAVWNFEKREGIDHKTLIKLVSESESDGVNQEQVAKNLFTEFFGDFQELCKDCFYGCPPKITGKRWNNTCTEDAAHTWNPVLVHHVSDSQGKNIYNEIRFLPINTQLQYCNHVLQGMPCWHEPTQCQSAHSEVEMAVWRAESTGMFVRPELLLLSKNKQANPRLQVEIYCKACFLVLSSQESFYRHCASLEHARMISDDTTTEWKHRPPPHGHRAQFWLCDRSDTCEYGGNCVKAHSVEELAEWLMQTKEEREIRQNIEAQGLMSYTDSLLEEYRHSGNEVHIISEHVDDVSITCDEDLNVTFVQIEEKFKWEFQIKTERLLAHVALLKQEPGASFSIGEDSSEACTYSRGEQFHNKDTMAYDIAVVFKSNHPGLYEQWLVFDFNMRPVLVQKLKVRIGKQTLTNFEVEKGQTSSQSLERWHRGSRVIIPCLEKKEAQEELLKEYKPPQMSLLYKALDVVNTLKTRENYKDTMHNFLYNEEKAQDQIVSRLHFCGNLTLSATLDDPLFGMKIAPQGELFGAIVVPYTLTPDTPEGAVLKHDVQSALIAPIQSNKQSTKVYEAIILRDTTSKNKMHLQLSKRCCSELNLQRNEATEVEIQFQFNRLKFSEMHKAVDLLPNMKMVLPDFQNNSFPLNKVQYPKLNSKQLAAIDFIIGDWDGKDMAPLLIYGPFGTGKTFTLATAAKELVKQPNTRVLICTHTNSSADLYVRDHFHPYIISGHHQMKLLRLKANKQGVSLSATDEITQKYCLLSQDGKFFLPPSIDVLHCHHVVITTTAMARHLHDLKLPIGYFTHILIDEASQMLECEALMPLGLAGPNTRVVLAGDHMQMGPKLFSVDVQQRSNHTLLNRLFHYYQGQHSKGALKSRIIFNENYRSTKEIVEFVSTHFYVGKSDVIKAVGNVPSHPSGHSLKFHHVRGECRLDTTSMSWFNVEEVAKVVEIVEDLLRDWPSTWEPSDPSSICVLSEGCQVIQIRNHLRKKCLGRVNVENIANVQGKQFRVIVMTTVQTRDSLDSSDSAGLEFFSDARVLNTAMTRAQSQVVVVGDAAGLCYFGNCSRTWKCFLDHCLSKDSVEPKHLTKKFIEDDLKEISHFQRSEYQGKSSQSETSSTEDNMDLILQQLTEECDHLSDVHSECEFLVKEKRLLTITETGKDALLELCEKYPNFYKQGELVMDKLNAGYIMPFDNPRERIDIKGRGNLGKSFPGDEVVIQNIYSQDQSEWMVLGITKKSSRLFVCTLGDEDYHKKIDRFFSIKKMIPINENTTQICILMSKKKRTQIPTWKYTDGQWMIESYQNLDENLRKNHVFLVEVINWKDHCHFPLGNVIDILPIGTSLKEGLKILDEEYEVQPLYEYPRDVLHETCYSNNTEHSNREDLRHLITFTVDDNKSKVLDDAISVADMGTLYEIGVHIADVASFVNPEDPLDQASKKRGATYYCPGKEPIYMLPKQLSINNYSLLPCQDRRVISLIVTVEKETDAIIDTKLQLSLIKSDKKWSYEEAEDIISELSGQEPKYDAVEHCVAVAYHFAKVQRKTRLPDNWSYARPDNHRMPGKRRSHQMIEELNIMFNKVVSEYLVNKQNTMDCTPLRCQEGPDPVTIKDLKDEHADLLPLSSFLRHQVDHNDNVSVSKKFHVLTHMWKEIQSAAEKGEVDILVDLIAADDMYPQLLPVITHFKKCLNKSFFVRSNSCAKASTGHYSMNLDFYTQASSPIRRYQDIILQRLLHSVLNGTPVQYSPQEIDILCQQSDNKCKKAEEYEKKAEMISCAVEMKKQNASKLAFVIDVAPERTFFKLSFPVEKHLFPDSLPVMYRDLQLEDQPMHNLEDNSVTLKWRKRVYSFETTNTHFELQRLQHCRPHIELPQTKWKAIVDSIDQDKFNTTRSLIKSINPSQIDGMISLSKHAEKDLPETQRTADETIEMEHYVDLNIKLRPSDSLRVQMTSETKRGYWTPTVQLVQLKPKFEVCVDHAKNPVECFAETPEHQSKDQYRNTNEYVSIWKPLCEMESAATAVAEGDNIIIEDLKLNFRRGKKLEGSFELPFKYIKEWAIECNLAKSLLCIRKRCLEMSARVNPTFHEVDPSDFTWVAHGITTKVVEPSQKSKNPAKKITFYINHLPMKTIPDCIFHENMTFTVEIIPKLTPDVRKESAVNNIVKANDLVQKIALGRHIPGEASQQLVLPWQIKREKGPDGLPELNDSQCQAVEKAINKNFTIIQGPPGTGKTVVGVYIVYWLLRLLSNGSRPLHDQKDKKEVILYCGPSNKSVDVVSEYLLTFGHKLKPLRVYSQQMEMQEYPYPGSTLQLSRRSLRQEQSKPELRKITLHHRIREDENPHAKEIKEFDCRICLANRSKENLLTDQEIDVYKKLLRKAREYELQRHDVILCTCTAASSPTLMRTVSARHILIDECAMATEPQALIPLVCNQPEKIVLLGDHKQLRPIVHHERVKKMGMSISLFERYIKVLKTRTVVLDTQYRMHEDICKFPSKAYYDGLLQTKVDCRDSVLCANLKHTPIVFGDIRGEEIGLVVSTAKGNENSKANREERDLAVNIAQLLVKKGKIDQQGIAILSPYNAQVSEIRKDLSEKNMGEVTVTTITKSQVNGATSFYQLCAHCPVRRLRKSLIGHGCPNILALLEIPTKSM